MRGDFKTPTLILLAAALLLAQPGCIRLSAGTWYKDADDESPTVHEVALDTGRLVNRDAYQPTIAMPEE